MIKFLTSVIVLLFLFFAAQSWADNYTYFKGPMLVESSSTILSDGGTISLSWTSNIEQVVTGTLSETVRLPPTATLAAGYLFKIKNRSTQNITVTDSFSASLATVTSGQDLFFKIITGGQWLVSEVKTLNGISETVQYTATGTSGTDFNITSGSKTHTFNIPDAGPSARGVVTVGNQTFSGLKTFSGGAINTPEILLSSSRSSGASISAGTQITPTVGRDAIVFVVGNGGSITSTASPPFITSGMSVGQKLSIIGTSLSNSVTYTASQTGISLNGDVELGKDDVLNLVFGGTDGSTSTWVETSRK